MKKQTAFLSLVLCLLVSTHAWAAPVQWTSGSGGNDHWYEVILHDPGMDGTLDPISWSYANTLATGSQYAGSFGYLASITSGEENQFVASLIGSDGWVYGGNGYMGPWLGGYQTENTSNAPWYWTSGEPWEYTSWEDNQPTNQTSGGEYQNYIHYYSRGTGDPVGQATWNDHYDDGGDKVFGYVVEYNAVPVPAAVWLLASGLVACLAVRRRS